MIFPKQLSELALSSWVGLAFDIDDTVTQHGKLQPTAFAAMWKLYEAGIKLIPVTGRPLGWAQVIIEQWPVDLVVAENGSSWVFQKDHHLHTSFFESLDTREHFDLVRQKILIKMKKHLPSIQVSEDQHLRACDLAFETGSQHGKAGISAREKEILEGIFEEHGAIAVHSSIHSHAHLGSFDKAKGFQKAVSEKFEESSMKLPENWVFVGDSQNDEPMFAYFPHSVGVKNIEPILPNLSYKPRYITQKTHGEGFAELAAHLLAVR